MKRKQFATRRMILRPYRLSDYPTWRDAYVNCLPKRNKYDKGPLAREKCSLREFRKIMTRHERMAKADRVYVYGAFLKSSGVLVGVVDVFVIVRDCYQMGNLGYQIHNRYWGRGYGKEAAIGALKIGFSHLKLNRLEAAVDLDNPRSLRLAKSIGMRREGVKKRYLFEDGKWTDNVVFAANPEDFGLQPQPPPKT